MRRGTQRDISQLVIGLAFVGAAVGVVIALANGYPWRWFEHDSDQAQQHDDLKAAETTPPVEVRAHQLAVDYGRNEVRADALYRGRMLYITGPVAGVYWDEQSGEPIVMLEADVGDIDDDIRARFDAHGDTSALQALHVGQRVTVDCLADPRIGAPVPRMHHCTLR